MSEEEEREFVVYGSVNGKVDRLDRSSNDLKDMWLLMDLSMDVKEMWLLTDLLDKV